MPTSAETETLEEIAIQNAEFFVGAGGKSLHYIPSLNARNDHADFLATLISQHAGGGAGHADASAREDSRSRAVAMGAKS